MTEACHDDITSIINFSIINCELFVVITLRDWWDKIINCEEYEAFIKINIIFIIVNFNKY